MAAVGNVNLARGASDQALPVSKKLSVKKEMQRLQKFVPKRVIERGAVLYPSDFAFLKNKAVKATAYPPLPDTPERRVMALANLYFTNVLPEEKEEEFFTYMDQLPGIDICDRSSAGDMSKTCDWHVFKEESWFGKADKARLFGGGAVEYLNRMGYERIQEPEVGAIIIYFHSRDAFAAHAGKAGHYGRVVEILNNGEPVIESKFCHMFVYRHRKDIVHSCFGSEYVYMRKISATENKS